MEAEHNTLRNTVDTERQESKILMEKMDREAAERKLSFHNLQEEMRHLLEQLEQARQAQAELQSRYSALEQKHNTEMEEKTSHILSLQKIEQELHFACDALKDENSKLLQEKSEQALHSAQAMQQLEGQWLIAFEAHGPELGCSNFRILGWMASFAQTNWINGRIKKDISSELLVVFLLSLMKIIILLNTLIVLKTIDNYVSDI